MRFDYSHGAMLRQHQDSLQRMGLSYLDSVVIHDLDHGYHTTPLSPPGMVEHHLGQLGHAGGGFRAREALRRLGGLEIAAIAGSVHGVPTGAPSTTRADRVCVRITHTH